MRCADEWRRQTGKRNGKEKQKSVRSFPVFYFQSAEPRMNSHQTSPFPEFLFIFFLRFWAEDETGAKDKNFGENGKKIYFYSHDFFVAS